MLLPDELPPFDITVTMANEYGASAQARILGVQIITDGIVAGIDDLYIEEQMSYIALAYVPIQPSAPFITTSPPPYLL
jgi:hypothetical protein